MTALTINLLGRISTGANFEDHQRTAEVVESAVESAQHALSNVLSDNANWDDAAIEMYKPQVDVEFARSAWGDPSETGVNYDLIMVVEQSGKLVTGFIRGKEQPDVDPNTYFNQQLTNLLARLPQNATEFAADHALISTSDGPAIVAAANLVPTTSGLLTDVTHPRFLVFAKYLTPDFVTGLGKKFVVKDLAFQSGETPGGYFVPQDSAGAPLGTMTWTDRRPGDTSKQSVMPLAIAMLVALLAVMSAIAVLCWRQFRQIGRREEQALHDSRHDALTGLPNRLALTADIDALLQAGKHQLCVLFVDLDGFKDVNDTYDHETGDSLIKAVAAGLAVLVPEEARIARIGGDEFIVAIPGDYADQRARQAADAILSFLEAPFDLDGRIAAVGASIGLAMSEPGMHAGELLRRADVAMYRAKTDGKNRCVTYTASMDVERNESAAIVEELRQIIATNRIAVAYQPIIDARTLQVTGVEALARWPSDVSRRIGPDKFIAIAETAGLIHRLGVQVLERACRDAAAWGNLRLSVNISPVQLRDPNFVQATLAAIDRTGMSRSRIELEVTEGTMIADTAKLRPVFEAMRAAGVSMALDDFGSGYSSIAYLRELPFSRIKIDRSLTGAMLTCEASRNMVQATGLIAHGVGAEVTAEGVEVEEAVQLLRMAGCNELQGYLFGKPQSAAAITALLNPPAQATAQQAA